MARSIQRFEDLIAWQKARMLAKAVFDVSGRGEFSKDLAMRGQIRRSARSVGANIAEGFERTGDREFHKGLSIACGSCAEVRSDLYLALDVGYLSQLQFDTLMQLTVECAKVSNALRAVVAKRIANS